MSAPGPRVFLLVFRVEVVLAIVACGTPSQVRATNPDIHRFVGTYEYVGGDEDIEALDRSIDEVVDQMNFLIRGIARRRLRAPNMPSKAVTVAVREGRIHVIRPGQPEVSAPSNGHPITWRHPTDRDVFQVSHGIDDRGDLYQRFEGERSESQNRFVLSGDDAVLTIHTVITADPLPAPLRFKMTYRRISPRLPVRPSGDERAPHRP